MDVPSIRELVWSPDDSAVEVERCGHRLRGRQVVDQLGENSVVLGMLENESRVLLINGLNGVGLSDRDGRSQNH